MFVIHLGIRCDTRDVMGYDAMLGMSWLSRHHAVIDYRSKIVLFKVPQQSESFIVGESRPSRQKQANYTSMTSQKQIQG